VEEQQQWKCSDRFINCCSGEVHQQFEMHWSSSSGGAAAVELLAMCADAVQHRCSAAHMQCSTVQ
jgi:hypothetical protein